MKMLLYSADHSLMSNIKRFNAIMFSDVSARIAKAV